MTIPDFLRQSWARLRPMLQRIPEVWRWRLQLIMSGLVGWALMYNYIETASYPQFTPPRNIEKSERHIGILLEKTTGPWGKLPYQIQTESGIISWGCASNYKFASYCPEHEVWKGVVGKRAELYLLPTNGSRYYDRIVLSLRVEGHEVVRFSDRYNATVVNNKSDADNKPIFSSLLVGFPGGVTIIMILRSRFRFR
jgi:hypothetical protein